ncbi:MAG: mannosyltransferase family protein [Thermoguttaceae bacterium]
MSFATVRNVESVEAGVGVYCLTWLVMAAGIAFGQIVMKPSAGPHSPTRAVDAGDCLVETLTFWDGQWYLEIADHGYSYQPDGMSSVAFFPGYPLLVAMVSKATGVPTALAALGVSHVFLLGSFVLFFIYARARENGEDETRAASARRMPIYALLAFGLFPPTFFLRMAYSESLFVFLCILAMYGMKRNWRPWQVAIIVGLTTAVRATGVALLLPLALYAWHRWAAEGTASSAADLANAPAGGGSASRSFLARFACPALRGLALAAVALSGLIAYVAYQYSAFGDPLAFAKTQEFWRNRVPADLADKTLSLASWEPLWSAYMPSSGGSVMVFNDRAPGVFSLFYANPLFFTAAVALTVAGAWKGWLSKYETAFSAGLILIPYVGKGFEMCMASQGRFVAVVFPMYIVLGNLLCRLPLAASGAILASFGVYLAIYSAMLAAGYVLI